MTTCSDTEGRVTADIEARVWVRDPAWRRTLYGKTCRWSVGRPRVGGACNRSAVAELQRGSRRPRWWAYCEDHLYGRRFDKEHGIVLIDVHPDSPLAKAAALERQKGGPR